MSTKRRTNWRTFWLGLVAALLTALALAITSGNVPVPQEAAWLAPIAVAGIAFVTPKLQEIIKAEEEDEEPRRTFADLPYKVPPKRTPPPRPAFVDPRDTYWPETVVDPGAAPSKAAPRRGEVLRVWQEMHGRPPDTPGGEPLPKSLTMPSDAE
jgi:hypothetical protein